MNRRARLLMPLLLAIALLAVYFVEHTHQQWVERLQLDARRVDAVLLFLALLPLILFAVRALDLVAFDVLASRRTTVRAPMLLRELVSIALFLILLAWAMWQVFDYKLTAFLATGTVLAAVLGLALQETLGNLFAGIALHLEDSFEVGDVIRSGEYFGVVEAMRWRGTRLRTFNNNVVIVPNSLLARERVEVFPKRTLNGRVLQFGIDYNIPPAEVIEVLTRAASNVDGVAREMPAFARVAAFGDSSITYEVKYFTYEYVQRERIDADIRKAVWYALRRNGIPIPFPIRSIHRYTPPAPRTHPDADDIAERLAVVDVLAPIGREARAGIAAAARVHVYARGETILSRGAAGDSMFIVHQGSVSVRVNDREVAHLQAGDFFGEMALLTGEQRAADVVALGDVVAIEIAKHALQPVLIDHPELAAAISAKILERRGTLDTLRAGSREEAERTVLSRIRAWFGL